MHESVRAPEDRKKILKNKTSVKRNKIAFVLE